MTLTALIRKRDAGTTASDNPAKAANPKVARERPLAGLATLTLAKATSPEAASLPDPAAEARRQRVLTMLAQHPNARYALLSETRSDQEAVLLSLAIRGRATCEMRVPRENYDWSVLIDLIDRHGTIAR